MLVPTLLVLVNHARARVRLYKCQHIYACLNGFCGKRPRNHTAYTYTHTHKYRMAQMAAHNHSHSARWMCVRKLVQTVRLLARPRIMNKHTKIGLYERKSARKSVRKQIADALICSSPAHPRNEPARAHSVQSAPAHPQKSNSKKRLPLLARQRCESHGFNHARIL